MDRLAVSVGGTTYRVAMTDLEQHWFTTKEAAEYIRSTPDSLKAMRSRGTGPAFARNGRIVRYTREALDAFLNGGD